MSYLVGDRFWVSDDEHAWVVGLLRSAENGVLEFSTERCGTKRVSLKELGKQRLDPCGSHIEDSVENLVDLDELSEGAILHHVRNRFAKKVIYTHVGSILVAVNPFEDLDIYSEREVRRAAEATAPYPHVFVTAATAYRQLRENGKNQSVLISGESGAGKTETTKKVLAYLANVAPDSKPRKPGEPGVETKILQSNPLLEALGNAKTLRNNNSSRFGKWMKVGFDKSFHIQGCEIVNYLLEKSRVVSQSPEERNYHIFYQIIAGADAAMRARLKLLSPQQYRYLNTSGCMQIKGVDDAREFQDVLEAMQTLQFSASTVESLLKILAGVLALGNLEFERGSPNGSEANASAGNKGEGDDEYARLTSQSEQETMKVVAELLALDASLFLYSLTNKSVQMGKGGRGSVVSMHLSVTQAADARDTLAKSLYSLLFDWVIQRVNTTLKTEKSPFSIGILDIFGFEVFDVNSFEQLCINYANEKLQFHFNEVIFSEEMNMYTEEAVPLDKIAFEDNGECVNLIEGKPFGLLSLLEEECSLGTATDLTYINKCEKTFGVGKAHANKFFVKHKTRPEVFSVVHFAGAVEYNVTSFLDKNRDNLSVTSREVMRGSQLSLVSELFSEKASEDTSSNSKSSGDGKGAANSNSNTSKSTLGGQFRNQLIGLIANLRTTEPHFIRCVKPNHDKVGGKFDGHLALRQLRYAGLFEAIRIRKAGFAYRANFAVFANTYQVIIPGLAMKRERGEMSDTDACWYILQQITAENKLPREHWQLGAKQRVFLKTNHDRVILERERNMRIASFVLKIQRMIRKALLRLRRKREEKMEQRELQIKQVSLQKESAAAVIIQKYWRRFSVYMLLKAMDKFIELRRVLLRKETHKVRAILAKIESELPPDVRSLSHTLTQTQSSAHADSQTHRSTHPHTPAHSHTHSRSRSPVSHQTSYASQTAPTQRLTRTQREQQRQREAARLAQQHVVWQLFAHEIKVARTMLRVMDVQDQLLRALHTALHGENNNDNNNNTNNDDFNSRTRSHEYSEKKENTRHAVNVRELNRLLLKADKLELNAHPLVIEAREALQRLFRKQQVFKQLLHFVQHEEDFDPEIHTLLEEAKALQIPSSFVENVRMIYEQAGPRWQTRNRLRATIEQCDRYGIERLSLEAMQIRRQHKDFAEMELRAARMMLRLLHFDEMLFPSQNTSGPASCERESESEKKTDNSNKQNINSSDSGSTKAGDNGNNTSNGGVNDNTLLWGRPVLSSPCGPRLTPTVIELCDAITESTSAQAARVYKQRLQRVTGDSLQALYATVRCYKWSRSLCVWKYPEVRALERERLPDPVSVSVNAYDSERTQAHTQKNKSTAGKGLSALFNDNNDDFSPFLANDDGPVSPSIHTPQRHTLSTQRTSTTTPRGGAQPQDTYSERDDDETHTDTHTETPTNEEFFGLRFTDVRANPYIIRSLHQDFDLYEQRTSNGEMEAAIANVALSQSVQETLQDLEGMLDVDLKIPLPNGKTYEKTAKRTPAAKSLSSSLSPAASPVQMNNNLAASPLLSFSSSLRRTTSATATTMATPSTPTQMKSSLSLSARSASKTMPASNNNAMFSPGATSTSMRATSASMKETRKAPMPSVAVKRVQDLSEDNLEKQLLLSREKKKAELNKISKDLEKMKRTSSRGWH